MGLNCAHTLISSSSLKILLTCSPLCLQVSINICGMIETNRNERCRLSSCSVLLHPPPFLSLSLLMINFIALDNTLYFFTNQQQAVFFDSVRQDTEIRIISFHLSCNPPSLSAYYYSHLKSLLLHLSSCLCLQIDSDH